MPYRGHYNQQGKNPSRPPIAFDVFFRSPVPMISFDRHSVFSFGILPCHFVMCFYFLSHFRVGFLSDVQWVVAGCEMWIGQMAGPEFVLGNLCRVAARGRRVGSRVTSAADCELIGRWVLATPTPNPPAPPRPPAFQWRRAVIGGGSRRRRDDVTFESMTSRCNGPSRCRLTVL